MRIRFTSGVRRVELCIPRFLPFSSLLPVLLDLDQLFLDLFFEQLPLLDEYVERARLQVVHDWVVLARFFFLFVCWKLSFEFHFFEPRVSLDYALQEHEFEVA